MKGLPPSPANAPAGEDRVSFFRVSLGLSFSVTFF